MKVMISCSNMFNEMDTEMECHCIWSSWSPLGPLQVVVKVPAVHAGKLKSSGKSQWSSNPKNHMNPVIKRAKVSETALLFPLIPTPLRLDDPGTVHEVGVQDHLPCQDSRPNHRPNHIWMCLTYIGVVEGHAGARWNAFGKPVPGLQFMDQGQNSSDQAHETKVFGAAWSLWLSKIHTWMVWDRSAPPLSDDPPARWPRASCL